MPSSAIDPTLITRVRARHAASLLVVAREGARHTVVMGLRGAGHRFMPNRLVFPGGAVDPEDADAPAATPLSPWTRAALERSANPPLAHALGIAAARELYEETAMTLGHPPALDGLYYLCRAVTPPEQPIRFNARFLIVDAEHVRGTIAGSGELEGLRPYDLDEALSLDLAWVTKRVLEHLTDFLALSEADRRARTEYPVCRKKTWRME